MTLQTLIEGGICWQGVFEHRLMQVCNRVGSTLLGLALSGGSRLDGSAILCNGWRLVKSIMQADARRNIRMISSCKRWKGVTGVSNGPPDMLRAITMPLGGERDHPPSGSMWASHACTPGFGAVGKTQFGGISQNASEALRV